MAQILRTLAKYLHTITLIGINNYIIQHIQKILYYYVTKKPFSFGDHFRENTCFPKIHLCTWIIIRTLIGWSHLKEEVESIQDDK